MAGKQVSKPLNLQIRWFQDGILFVTVALHDSRRVRPGLPQTDLHLNRNIIKRDTLSPSHARTCFFFKAKKHKHGQHDQACTQKSPFTLKYLNNLKATGFEVDKLLLEMVKSQRTRINIHYKWRWKCPVKENKL